MTTPESDELTPESIRLQRLVESVAQSPQVLWELVERLGELRYKLKQARLTGEAIFQAAEEYRGVEKRLHAAIDRTTNIMVELIEADLLKR
jgi:hypothetical protein